MTKFTINSQLLKAAACAVDPKGSRFHLRGVLLEYRPEYAVLVGTDGTKMIVARGPWDGEAPEPFEPVIIPLDLIRGIKAPKKFPEVMVSLVKETKIVEISTISDKYIGYEIEGFFPDWRQILPREPANGKAAQYDPKLLVCFQEAMKILECDSPIPKLAHNGENPTLVDMGHPDAFGIVMPYRVHKTAMATPPDWANL